MTSLAPCSTTFTSIRYTFETYKNAAESRHWLALFYKEHNGCYKSALKVSQGLTHLIVDPQQQWIRVKHDGLLIGYARVNHEDAPDVRISDVYVLPAHRHKGHFHRFFHNLVVYSRASGVSLILEKALRYWHFYSETAHFKYYRWLSQTDDLLELTSSSCCPEMALLAAERGRDDQPTIPVDASSGLRFAAQSLLTSSNRAVRESL